MKHTTQHKIVGYSHVTPHKMYVEPRFADSSYTINTPPCLRIFAQNTGGMRGEFNRQKGAKFAAINSFMSSNTDFVILSETKINVTAIGKKKLKFGLTPTLASSQQGARGGVAVFSHPKHNLLEGSKRESEALGHFVCGVFQVNKSRIIIAGVYGRSDNLDGTASRIIGNLNETLDELKFLYNTNNVIVAGDFNATRSVNDSHNRIMNKPKTAEQIEIMVENHNLTDVARATGNAKHTWYRRGPQKQSSRIDYILTNMQTAHLHYSQKFTIFDHCMAQATIGVKNERTTITMKDHILGTDEYIITATTHIENTLARLKIRKCDTVQNGTEEARLQENGEDQEREEQIDEESLNEEDLGLVPGAFPTKAEIEKTIETLQKSGTTALQEFNTIVTHLQGTHNKILKEMNKRNRDKINKTNNALIRKQREKFRTFEQERIIEIEQEIHDIQRQLANSLEMKQHAANQRIKNFYKTNTGKNVPVTFACIKEKNKNREIQEIEHDNRRIITSEEIVQTMQQWYEDTANTETEQRTTLEEFLQRQDIQLPQITEEQKEEIEEEFSVEEVKAAMQEASEASASGPSGQSIAFYKLLFMEIPALMTAAINQLTFVPGLADLEELKWIRTRKIVYIPKKNDPRTPSDFRPLSMLEVLYKIPSRILARRLSNILPTIIGPHQHGFMAGRSIQEPILMATATIQEANKEGKPLQLLSFDIEKAFDKTGHQVIIQALRAFGIPENTVQAIKRMALFGYAYVEVNGKKGILIMIKTGSGQGDPISSILFLMATEPLNRALIKKHENIFYKMKQNICFGAFFYADDNLVPVKITNIQDIIDIQNTYNEYREVSGLNVNMRKSTALCINTSQELIRELNQLGIQTPEQMRYLGVQLGKTMQLTVQRTMEHIEPKTIKRRILATTPPTDLLHRCTLINRALVPIYNHVFMTLPMSMENANEISTEIYSFLWTKQEAGITKQKRRLVAKDRISAGCEMGGLSVNTPAQMMDGMQQNLIQKIYRKIDTTQETIYSRRHNSVPVD